MYISIRDDVALWGGTYPSLKEALDDLGVEAVELRFERDCTVAPLTPADGSARRPLDSPDAVKQYRDHLAQHRVRATALLLLTDFNQPEAEAEVQWVVSAVRAAQGLGMATVRVDSNMTGQRELPFDERVARVAAAVTRVLRETEETPVALGIENHGFQGNDPAWLDALFAAVGSPRFGMTLDTGNFYWAGHPLDRVYEILEHFAPRAKHTHCKNIAYPAELRNQQRDLGWKYGEYVAPFDEGDIDHRRVIRLLRAAGYDGDLCIEDESMGHYDPAQWREVLRRDVAHFRELLA
ncbi:MAG TPA: sugar phosphate isomerase/epimerase family protein [Armatimonadota bacterium]|nr:sugar phosphate isomerase/epimerase family protein [Armatimonadota bacterium]